jgi:hypothetical protein
MFKKKFWHELIACFPLQYILSIWYDTDRIESASFVVFVFAAAETCLPSRCVATVGGGTDTDGKVISYASYFLKIRKVSLHQT